MKKILLGTSALVAAAAFSAPASAAEKIKLSLDGYATFGAAYVDSDIQDSRDITFGSDAEVHFKGDTTLDNGLKVGFKAELELEKDTGDADFTGAVSKTTADVIDEVYMYVSGGFGEIQFGQNDGVADQFQVYAPWVFVEHGANDYDMSAAGQAADVSVLSILDESDDYTKITYMSPRVGGFQFGASYTPEGEKNRTGYNNILDNYDRDGDGLESIFEAAVNYERSWNDVDFAASATYLTADVIDTFGFDSSPGDFDGFSLGSQLCYAGFCFGGSYTERETDESGVNTERHDWDLGATYEIGPWILGVNYGSYSGATKPDPMGVISDPDAEQIVGGVAYKLGPGIQIGLGYEQANNDETDEEASAVFTEFAIDF
ncbi:MAG: porin [Alphaproteobacteria bacterium]|nr:porin [Alphaproteobacteria bacterium]